LPKVRHVTSKADTIRRTAELTATFTYNSAIPPDLSIVLVNWNACAMTIAALESIANRTHGIRYEVIVVDNGTTKDDSVRELPRRFPSIAFIANPRNMGFSVASNQGMARARGRYVLLLNTDTIQTQDALTDAVRYMDAHAEVGVLGILHCNADASRSPQASAFPFPRPWREVLSLAGLATPAPNVEAPTAECDVDWLCGSFFLMRRSCMEQVGPLDERFFVYAEDVDWCRRAWQAGWKIRFWPGASMTHIGASAQPFIKDKTFMHFRSHLAYIRKHHGWLPAMTYYLGMMGRLSGATIWQTVQWMTGRVPFSMVRERSTRQWRFALLRSGRLGVD
jgi:N-acetylglucosaminyl-diphospho-decaprenol L-rhamnosyltransferase